MKDIFSKTGRKLKEIREQKGLSQRELARRINRSNGYISALESGNKTANIKILDEIATALKVDISDFFENEGYLVDGMSLATDIGQKIRRIRINHNLSLVELGEKLNFNYSNLSKIERGEREASVELLLSISRYFNMSVDYFLNDDRVNWEIVIAYCDSEKISPKQVLSLLKAAKSI